MSLASDSMTILRDEGRSFGLDASSMDALSHIMMCESGGDPNAHSKTSSACGLFQFTEGTWRDICSRHHDIDPNGIRDPRMNARAAVHLMLEEVRALRADGYDATGGQVYLANFAGIGGAKKILAALKRDPATPAEAVMGAAAANANPMLKHMSVSQLMAWADKKVGGKISINPVASRGALGWFDGSGDGDDDYRREFTEESGMSADRIRDALKQGGLGAVLLLMLLSMIVGSDKMHQITGTAPAPTVGTPAVNGPAITPPAAASTDHIDAARQLQAANVSLAPPAVGDASHAFVALTPQAVAQAAAVRLPH